MTRQTKYYVSTKDGVQYDGIRRLSPYYKTENEAFCHYYRVFNHYNTLMVRTIAPDNKTRATICSK